MKGSPIVFIVILFLYFSDLHFAFASLAQPVPIPEDQSTTPQIEFAGVGIGTLGLGKTLTFGKSSGFNFSDSSLLFGAAQRLYHGGIGSFSLAGLSTHAANRGNGTESSFFIHQAVLDYQTATFEAAIGRTDNQNSHFIDFPTLRGDDLVTLTNPANPFSNGMNPEEHRYANVAAVTFNQNLSYFENLHVQHLIDSARIGSDSAINSVGASFQYMASPGLENFSRVPLWGVGYEHMVLSQNADSGLNQVYGGAIVNLNQSVTDLIDLRFQDTLSIGSHLNAFQNISNSFQADSNALALSLRCLHKPFSQGGYQVSLTTAYKTYFNVDQSNAYGGALTGVKQLGEGFSAIVQYQGEFRSSTLASVQSQGLAFENILEIGFLFNFDAIFNQHISPRRSLLNQQHEYIPN